jgi:Mg2+-importing ATPase
MTSAKSLGFEAPVIASKPAGVAGLARFWNLPLAELTATLETTPTGLTEAEAARHLARYGPNAANVASRFGPLVEFGRLLLNPLVLILLIASGVSAIVGDTVGSVIIIAIVLVSLVLDFYQTYRSQAAAQRLARMIATTASVYRDGKLREIPFRELVPGDVIALSSGDLVPADCRLLQSRFLSVNQAALTGESLPTSKEASDLASPADSPAEASNAVFLGSSVESGTASALVVNTGANTELGHISTFLRTKPPATEFERGMHSFAALIARTVAILVLVVFLANAVAGRNPLESFLFAIALAVGLTPELMPMIVTVTLAQGALRMASKRVVVRHLPAIQNLGAIDILCSDKTGTLTQGKVEVASIVNPLSSDASRARELAQVNSALESGLRNALDDAIRRQAPVEALAGYEKIDELPFDFIRRRESVIAKDPHGQLLLITKGSPESVIALCIAVEVDGRVRFCSDDDRAKINAAFHGLSEGGYRSLGVAYRTLAPDEQCATESERDLIFVGLVGFEDPPLEDAAKTIEALRQQGVRLIVLTGDDPIIAHHVCQTVGLGVGRTVTGPEVDLLTDPALGAVAEEVSLFARLTPAQKNRIIGALKARGHVVGYMGDGINDAPSLHSADVGISVSGAVDVAREAAEVILLESSLAVLLDGIVEGRKSFGNIQKYIMMGTSSNFGNMFSMAGATIVLPFLPLLPVQILLNNLLYDLSQIMLPSDEVDPELTAKGKRWNMGLVRDFMLVFGPISSLFDFLTFGFLWFAFNAQRELFRTGWFVESLATQVLVIYVIRTMRPPWRSRPSRGLVIGTVSALIVGIVLPMTSAKEYLGFATLPAVFYLYLIGATIAYLWIVENAKRWFFRHHTL